MNFDRLAPYYYRMERVLGGNKLQRCRVEWMGEVTSAKRALLAGEGHGRFLGECARRLPDTHFTYVDASAGMLEQARKAWRMAGGLEERITFVQATLPDWEPEAGAHDLIVTHFFLDCFPPSELARVVAALARAAKPGTNWLLADFREPERGLLKWRARLIVGSLYLFFRVVTRLPSRKITPPDELMRQNGFELEGRRLSEWGLLHSDWWKRTLTPALSHPTGEGESSDVATAGKNPSRQGGQSSARRPSACG